MHLKRWLTGIVAVPLLIYVVGFGPRRLFHLVLLLAALQGLIEFYRIACPDMPKTLRSAMLGLTVVLFLVTSVHGLFFLAAGIFFSWAAVPMIYFTLTYPAFGARNTELLGKAVLGPVYISLPLSLLVMVDRFPGGAVWIFLLLATVFANDTGAFYAGRFFGRRKLHPLVSPGKTWEGTVGGCLATVLAAWVWCAFSGLYPFGGAMAAFAVGVAVLGQVGDLAESMLKRTHGVKDSGGILPGHGGILDRIDGLLFAIPLLYVFLTWSVSGRG
jgi:phosphatidate cytidylyltransferase